MLAAVAQLCSGPVVATNLKRCLSVIREAATAGASLVWLPEASDFIAPQSEVPELAQPLDGDFVRSIVSEASKNSIWVGIGVHEKGAAENSGKCWNTNLLIRPENGGEIVQAYRKIHLFDVDIKGGPIILESNTTIPGKELLDPAASPLGKVGLLTCYDIRFPEVSLTLRRRGAQILTYPSAFTVLTGEKHWEILLRARAVESQCYILAPAQNGFHTPARASWGHSMIVDPWGTVIAEQKESIPVNAGEAGTFVTAEVDLERLEKIRREMPLWTQRRSDVYPEL